MDLTSFATGVPFDIRPEFFTVFQHTWSTWISKSYT